MNTTRELTNLQQELLKIFSFEISDQQLNEVRTLLSSYFAAKATQEMDRLWEENNWTDETINEWAEEHMRTVYKP